MTLTTTSQLYEIFLAHPKVSTDTRNIAPGSIFFALKGGNFNGNAFAKEALAKGAAYAVIDEQEFSGERCLPVADVLAALQQLARHHRVELGKKKVLHVLGLTGSNGKTTTKELLARVLSKKFKTLFTEGNLNNHIGVPLTLLRLDETHEAAVIEMGANHQGEIAQLCGIAEPDYGLITNVGLAHLEGFGGPEGVLKGKTELFDALERRDGTAFVLADDERIVKRATRLRHFTYGTAEGAEVKGRFISAEPFVRFAWQAPRIAEHEVQTQMIGAYNLPNMIAACAVGVHFGIAAIDIDEAIASYAPANKRSQVEKRGTNTLILDCYNANPSSMAAAIDNLAKMPAEKKIAVLGDMFELGDSAAEEHQRVADLAAEKLHNATILLVGKLFGAVKGRANMIRLPDAAAAAECIKQYAPQDSLILIKGSRGMKMEGIIESL